MRKFLSIVISFTILFFSLISCSTKTFIAVEDSNRVLNGTKAILVDSYENVDYLQDAFIDNGLLISNLEGGFITEEFLIDDSTRGKFKVIYGSRYYRIIAYWGITAKVQANIAVWAGTNAANSIDPHSLEPVIYSKNEKRPKQVFDYAIQILESKGIEFKLTKN